MLAIAFLPAQQETDFSKLSGPYLGQPPPGRTPQLFAPRIISTALNEGSSGFDLPATRFLFQRRENGRLHTMETELTDTGWSQPKMVPFAGMMRNGDFTFAPDGRTLYFQSNRPIEGLAEEGVISNIWVTRRTDAGWTEPAHLDLTINTRWADSFASATTGGTLYFFSRKPGGLGKSDMYRSRSSGGRFLEAENLGDRLNTAEHEWDPFVAADESYLIFCSTKAEGYGMDDLYISFRTASSSWREPVNLGENFNSPGSENRPYVTPDGKYFFYTSTKRGNRDIYWVDAGILETYRIRRD
jgi:hypothetical protein